MNLHRSASASTSSSPPAREASALRRRLKDIEEELGKLFYELYRERQQETGLDGDPGGGETLQLSLRVKPSPHNGASVAGSDELYRQLRQTAHRTADRRAAYPSGHVYCHWCRSFTCPHSTPGEPRQVFAGYSPTGQPVWVEYSSILLERGDPRIEILYREEPGTVPLVQSGKELARRQLAVYGKRSSIYRILGQVLLGYLVDRQGNGTQDRVFAVTFQAVEAAGERTPAHLNVIGRVPDGAPAAQALGEHFDPRFQDALLTARRRLAEIHLPRGSRRSRSSAKTHKVLEVLRLLSKNFERIFRQGKRRTLHSQTRHRNRQRPASVALRDALAARSGAIYRDVKEKTWVVLGPKNRVHIFNDRALHVTSVVYPGDTVRQRTARGRWHTPKDEEAALFVEALRLRAEEKD